MIKTKKGKIITSIGIVIIFAIGSGIAYYLFVNGFPTFSPNKENPPKFITANYIDLSKVTAVSKYRSLAGHDFSDGTETCTSLKHYFYTPPTAESTADNALGKIPSAPDQATGIAIYAPADGTITTSENENYPIGKQVHMSVNGYPSYRIIMFHIYLLSDIKVGTSVKSGERIGTIIPGYESDFAVTVNTFTGVQDLSMFAAMIDSVFDEYKARGAASRSDFILTKDYRAAHAFPCPDEKFPQNSNVWQYANVDGAKAEWFHLSGYVNPPQPSTAK